MYLRIVKCALLTINSGIRQITESVELPNQEKIIKLGENKTYKFSRILEPDTIKHGEMKEKVKNSILGEQKITRNQTI